MLPQLVAGSQHRGGRNMKRLLISAALAATFATTTANAAIIVPLVMNFQSGANFTGSVALANDYSYAFTKHASDCGRSMQKKWIFCRTPPITATASPKSTWPCPGGCASGTNVSRPRARQMRT